MELLITGQEAKSLSICITLADKYMMGHHITGLQSIHQSNSNYYSTGEETFRRQSNILAVHTCTGAVGTRLAARGITGSLKHLLHLSFGLWGLGRSVGSWQSFFGAQFIFSEGHITDWVEIRQDYYFLFWTTTNMERLNLDTLFCTTLAYTGTHPGLLSIETERFHSPSKANCLA